MHMKSEIEYYMKLEYGFEITPLPPELGIGYEACIPQLGRYAFVGKGKTIEEALKNLENRKRKLFEKYLDEGIEIPEPKVQKPQAFSGKFALRMPVDLHRELAEGAKNSRMSLNSYLIYLLTKYHGREAHTRQVERILRRVENLEKKMVKENGREA